MRAGRGTFAIVGRYCLMCFPLRVQRKAVTLAEWDTASPLPESMRRLPMQRRSLLAAFGALLAGGLRTDTTAKTASSMPEPRFIAWPVLAETTPGMPAINGHTDTVPDIVGRIGVNDLVVFTEGNHFPVLFGGEVLQPFRDWAKGDRRFANVRLEDITVV